MTDNPPAPERFREAPATALAGALALVAFFGTVLYAAFAARAWFYADDFDWVWWTSRQSWGEALFSTRVYLYYRPLFAILIKALHAVAGMNAWPYAVLQLALHFIHLMLGGLVLARLFADRRLVVIALALYAASPLYDNALLWRSNLSTQLAVIFTFAAVWFAIQWLTRPPAARAFFAMIATTLAALASKQSGAQILLVVPLAGWAALAMAPADERKPLLRRLALGWLVLAALTGAWLAADRTLFTQAYPWFHVASSVQAPATTLRVTLQAMSMELIFLRAWHPLISAPASLAGVALGAAPWLTLVFGAALWLRGSRAERFGWTFSLLCLFPAALGSPAITPRLFYGGLLGHALLWASLGLRLWDAAGNGEGKQVPWKKAIRAAAPIFLIYVLLNNAIAIQWQGAAKARRGANLRSLYHALEASSEIRALPPQPFLLPQYGMAYFPHGAGLVSFARLALDDDSALAFNLTPQAPAVYESPPPEQMALMTADGLQLTPIADSDKREMGYRWRWE